MFMCRVWGKGNKSLLGSERQVIYEVVPRLGLGLGAICGGYFMQSVLFDFEEIFVLEGGYKLILLGIVAGGILLMFLNGFRGFKMLKFKGGGVKKIWRSFFVSI